MTDFGHERIFYSPDGKSSMKVYSDDLSGTTVIDIWDADSFSDGVHEARFELSAEQVEQLYESLIGTKGQEGPKP